MLYFLNALIQNAAQLLWSAFKVHFTVLYLLYSAFAYSCPAPTDIFVFFIALSHYCRPSSVMFG